MNPNAPFKHIILSACYSRVSFFVVVLLAFCGPLNVLADIQITDSHGKYHFTEPPKRVVALNWTLAEQMLELGETPIGMADIEGFRKQASLPVIPDTVVDVGERLSPKLKNIQALKPDIILIGYSQRSLLRPLSNIATVIYFKNFGNRYNNFEKSRERFLEMAKLFDKTEFAQRKLKAMDQQFKRMKNELAERYKNSPLPILQFMIPQTKAEAKKDKAIWVFGNNSMPFYAAQQLGLEVISPDKTNQFGAAQIKADRLNHDYSVCHILLPTYKNSEPMSKQLPAKCTHTLNYQNAFGGVMSVLYLSEALFNALH